MNPRLLRAPAPLLRPPLANCELDGYGWAVIDDAPLRSVAEFTQIRRAGQWFNPSTATKFYQASILFLQVSDQRLPGQLTISSWEFFSRLAARPAQ